MSPSTLVTSPAAPGIVASAEFPYPSEGATPRFPPLGLGDHPRPGLVLRRGLPRLKAGGSELPKLEVCYSWVERLTEAGVHDSA